MYALQSSITQSALEQKVKHAAEMHEGEGEARRREQETDLPRRTGRSGVDVSEESTSGSSAGIRSVHGVVVFVRVGEHTRLVNLPQNSSLRCLKLRTLHAFDCREPEGSFQEPIDMHEDSDNGGDFDVETVPGRKGEGGGGGKQKHHSFMIEAVEGKKLKRPRILRRTDLQNSCTITVANEVLRSALLASAGDGRFPELPYVPLDSESDYLVDRLNNFFNVPGSSLAATCWAVLIILLIVVSTSLFTLETIPSFYQHEDQGWSTFMIIEAFCISTFTFEYLCRLLVARSKIAFVCELLNVIDLVSIIPFYIEIIFSGAQVPSLQVLRVIRLVRVFRLFKVSKGALVVLAETIQRSLKPLYMLVFMSIVVVIVCASVIYYCERGKYNETLGVWMRPAAYDCSFTCTQSLTGKLILGIPECEYVGQRRTGRFMERAGDLPERCVEIFEQTPFDSIPAAGWFAFTTVSTVGYGDITPMSTMGRVTTMITMLVGILTMGLPITVIGSNFSKLYHTNIECDLEEED